MGSQHPPHEICGLEMTSRLLHISQNKTSQYCTYLKQHHISFSRAYELLERHQDLGTCQTPDRQVAKNFETYKIITQKLTDI